MKKQKSVFHSGNGKLVQQKKIQMTDERYFLKQAKGIIKPQQNR